jgi:hypothetical protein
MTRFGEGQRDIVPGDFDYRRVWVRQLGELPTRRALNFLSGHLSGELDVL